MKATLEFDLDDYTERKAHKRCVGATDAYTALHEIDNKLREYDKYQKNIQAGDEWALPLGKHKLTEIEAELMWALAARIRSEINYIVRDLGVNLDDLE